MLGHPSALQQHSYTDWDGISGDCPVQPPAHTRVSYNSFFRTVSSQVLSCQNQTASLDYLCQHSVTLGIN